MGSSQFRCRRCGSHEIHPSRSRNLLEKYLLPLLRFRPVRCGHCLRRRYCFTHQIRRKDRVCAMMPPPEAG